MKIKLLSFFSFLLLATCVGAQEKIRQNESTGFATLTEAAQMAEQIVKAAGVKANFMIAEARVSNALAVLHQGKRYVLYNPDFIDALTRATGTKWAAISVLAHEIGHHLYHRSIKKGTAAMATELEADEFSGYVLEKMGATLAEAQAAMKVLATTYATRTHPARLDRISSIASGWKNAGGIETAEEAEQRTQPSSTYTINRQTVQRPGNIAATIFFNASPGSSFYVSTAMNVLHVGNDRVSKIGRITRSNNHDYPFIIYDDTGYRLYVDTNGQIFDRNGNPVGKMKAGAA